MFYIYVITNDVNNKRYVGYTSKTPKYRFNKHLIEARGKVDNVVFHNAIRKYGEEHFSVESVDQCNTLEEAHALERKHIALLETLMFDFPDKGYNMTKGGEGALGFKPTQEQIETSRQKRVGKKWSEQAKENFSKRISGPNNHRWGKTNSPEHKEAIRKANMGRVSPRRRTKHSPETITKMSEARKRNPASPETIAKMRKSREEKLGDCKGTSNPNAKQWKLTNTKTGEVVIVEDFKQWCAEHDW